MSERYLRDMKGTNTGFNVCICDLQSLHYIVYGGCSCERADRTPIVGRGLSTPRHAPLLPVMPSPTCRASLGLQEFYILDGRGVGRRSTLWLPVAEKELQLLLASAIEPQFPCCCLVGLRQKLGLERSQSPTKQALKRKNDQAAKRGMTI